MTPEQCRCPATMNAPDAPVGVGGDPVAAWSNRRRTEEQPHPNHTPSQAAPTTTPPPTAAREHRGMVVRANGDFRKGDHAESPFPDWHVDVVISHCVINLSGDKDRVLREAFRVLKPGGRFAVSDVVTRGEIAPEIRRSVLLWVGCVAGALGDDEFRSKLAAAGFEQIDIEPTRVYRAEDAREILSAEGVDVDSIAPQVDGKFMSAFVRAVKPIAQ